MNNINEQIDLIAQTRKNILTELDGCTNSQLMQIPTGFNNNIIWNVAHLIATMEILVYTSSNTSSRIEKELVDSFKKGTAPDDSLDDAMITSIKASFIQMLDQLRDDYQNERFGEYEERTTSYGVTLTSVEDAIFFCNLHESMHYGQIKMLRKLV